MSIQKIQLKNNKIMKEITEDYVSFEIAKLLKEKGFNEDIDLWYDETGELFFELKYKIGHNWRVRKNQKVYECPTLQMAMKWLRDVHNFHITAFPAWDNDDGTKMSFEKWGESIDGLDGEYCMPISGPVYYNSYEDACESAIKYSLENLI